ncbi:hypothetical protein [Sandarakinorhabdus sp. DWP1-3-1]|uniref:hypothetical protein n=1 Tax=Sandarakinorhabdus sp. DWP1-3-1 TaxID=2804627 RepID=UPI003CEBE037
MEPLLDEIRATFDCGIYYPVVSTLLMLPDACGAVEFWGQPKKPKERYVEWYDKWVLPRFTAKIVNFDGSVVYIVRNALIHESTGFTRGKHGFDRIIFVPPNRANVVVNFYLARTGARPNDAAFYITIKDFMIALDLGVREWLSEVQSDADKRRSDAVDKLIQYRPHGQWPYIDGLPIIC